MTASPRRTPLYDLIVAQNARMTPFAGWEMPVQFSGISQEHQAVRQQAGMFDISHMGKFELRGKELLAELQGLVPTDLSGLQPGQAQYTVLLNPEGGIMDDLIIYYQGQAAGEDRVRLIVNAATTEKDRDWLVDHLATAAFEDLSETQALVAV